MKISKIKLAAVLILIVLGAAAIFAYFNYQDTNYVSTIDARIDCKKANILPMQSGRLISWSGSEGQDVIQNEKLGTIEAGNAVSNIYVPMSGKLVQVGVTEGQIVSASQTVAVVADMNNIYVSANIEETKINKIREGQGVEIRLDAFPGKVYFGRVTKIGEAATSVFSIMSSSSSNGSYTKITQLIPIKIEFVENYDDPFKLGMNAEIKIHLK